MRTRDLLHERLRAIGVAKRRGDVAVSTGGVENATAGAGHVDGDGVAEAARGLLGRRAMFHHVARALPGTLLWRTWEEGLALWERLVAAFPELIALCVMPDHVHLVLPHADEGGRLARAMAAYARWRNAHRRTSGPVWESHPPAEAIPDRDHLRRTIRYTHMNPCRAFLVRDPLAWPFSTHRDAAGLAIPPAVRPVADPERFHRYVSADATTDPGGTELPTTIWQDVRWEDVRDAVTALCRVPPDAVLQRGVARTLAVQAAWVHGLRDVGVLAAACGMSTSRIYEVVAHLPRRGAPIANPRLAACVRVVGDGRFGPLFQGDLRRQTAWARYRSRH